MKLISYHAAGEALVGFVTSANTVMSLRVAFHLAGLKEQDAPTSMLDLIQRRAKAGVALGIAHRVAEENASLGVPMDNVSFAPPISTPSKILGVAINNRAISEIAERSGTTPSFFLKAPSSLIGHGQPIVIRPDYGLTHPEAELAVVIGERCKMVKRADAHNVVFGYTIMNDITSVSMKSEDTYVWPNPGITPTPQGFEFGNMQLAYHARSKGTDTFGPCGPWIVTADEISDPGNLAVQVRMADELCASDNTGNLRFTVAEVVEWASRYFTLEPGDIIHIGTAAHGRYGLRELDFQSWDGPCSVEITGIGTLVNPVLRVDTEGNPVAAKARPETPPWPPRMESAL